MKLLLISAIFLYHVLTANAVCIDDGMSRCDWNEQSRRIYYDAVPLSAPSNLTAQEQKAAALP